MRKIKKLVLKKTVIASLDDYAMNQLKGGNYGTGIDMTGPGSSIMTQCGQPACSGTCPIRL